MNKYERAMDTFRKNSAGLVTPTEFADIPAAVNSVAALKESVNNLIGALRQAGVLTESNSQAI